MNFNLFSLTNEVNTGLIKSSNRTKKWSHFILKKTAKQRKKVLQKLLSSVDLFVIRICYTNGLTAYVQQLPKNKPSQHTLVAAIR